MTTGKMTKRFKVVLVFLISFAATAAVSCVHSGLGLYPIKFISLSSVSELRDKLEDKDTFVLQLSLEGCEYCDHLSNVEEKLRIATRRPIYSLHISSKQKDEGRSDLVKLIDGFEFYPSIFYIRDGEVEDEFNLDDSSSIEPRLTEWLSRCDDSGWS